MKKYLIIILLILFTGCGGGNSSSEQNTASGVVVQKINMDVDFLGDNSISLHWVVPNNVRSYVLEYGIKGMGLDKSISLNSNISRYRFNDLDSNTTYSFRLITLYNDGKESSSEILNVKINPDENTFKSDIGPKI
jgi:hypothetical protein